MGGLPAPQTPWTWRSGARVPGHAGPIVAKVLGSAHKKEKSKEKKDKAKREDIKGYTNMGGERPKAAPPMFVVAREARCPLYVLSLIHI